MKIITYAAIFLVAPSLAFATVSDADSDAFISENGELYLAATYLFNIQAQAQQCSIAYPGVESKLSEAIKITAAWEVEISKYFVGEIPNSVLASSKARQQEKIRAKFIGEKQILSENCVNLAQRIVDRELPLDISTYVGK